MTDNDELTIDGLTRDWKIAQRKRGHLVPDRSPALNQRQLTSNQKVRTSFRLKVLGNNIS